MLITDGRCYSATDIFAAGFQDHRIGPVLGVDANTGAGGANVWTHELLRKLVQPRGGNGSQYEKLRSGVGMRVSIRRTLRVGDAAGTAVEDLGVVPDKVHQMTRRDIEKTNHDLIKRAVSLLREEPPRELDVKKAAVRDGMLRLTLTTAGIDRVDAYVDDRPIASMPVTAEPAVVKVPIAGARRLRLMGYTDGVLVANRRESLGMLPSGKLGILPGATLRAGACQRGSQPAPLPRRSRR